jgi:hypothetical protein
VTRAQVIAAYRRAAELARAQGVTVTFDPGWTSRGRDGLNPRCIVEHDTSDGARLSRGRMLDILRNGHGAISGNAIANDAVLPDGEVVVLASGVAWHAGQSRWDGLSGMNVNGLGTEYQRFAGDPLADVQLHAGRIWTRARMAAFTIPSRRVCEHSECAIPAGRKVDRSSRPGVRISGATWRASLVAPPTPTPVPEDDMPLSDADVEKVARRAAELVWTRQNPVTGNSYGFHVRQLGVRTGPLTDADGRSWSLRGALQALLDRQPSPPAGSARLSDADVDRLAKAVGDDLKRRL